MKKQHLIIDCSSLIYSSFYAYGILSYNGEKTQVIFGFLVKLLQLCKKYKTNKIYFCWDSAYNKRKDDYKEYKENREKRRKKMSPREFKDMENMFKQRDTIYESVLPTLGFNNSFEQYGYEADDLMAVICEELYSMNKKCLMVTSDADMYQCLDKCDILNPSTLKKMTNKIFQQEYKTTPNHWPMLKACGGCLGDNVIGIKGAADPAKSKSSKAISYIRGELKRGKIYERIESEKGQKIIERNLPIVTLPYKRDELKPIIFKRNTITKENLIKVFGRYNFQSFLEKDIFKHWERLFLL